jgi:acetyl-CoA carboxylase carboxyltransferase component
MIRRFLSYMPANVWDIPPRASPVDDPGRRDRELLSVIPKQRNRLYDPYKILRHVLDRDSLFEIGPDCGQSRITALARVNGYPVGVMIDNPNHLGGSLDLAAGSKATRFIQMCDTFHLPTVSFVDEPGFRVGLESEKQGLVRAGARLACAVAESRMPWIAFVVRQAYGVAGMLHVCNNGMYMRYAWPSANWGSMHIEGGVAAAYRRDIETAPDPQAKRDEIERKLKAITSPIRTAAAFGIEDVIDPRDTRPLLVEFVEDAQAELKRQVGPCFVPSYHP